MGAGIPGRENCRCRGHAAGVCLDMEALWAGAKSMGEGNKIGMERTDSIGTFWPFLSKKREHWRTLYDLGLNRIFWLECIIQGSGFVL